MSLGLPQNLCKFCNPDAHDYLRWKSCEGRSSSCRGIWWNMPIFAIWSKNMQLCNFMEACYVMKYF